MNRAEARVKSYQNSTSQLNPSKDMSVGNSDGFSFISHMKSICDEKKLARSIGRKKKRK